MSGGGGVRRRGVRARASAAVRTDAVDGGRWRRRVVRARRRRRRRRGKRRRAGRRRRALALGDAAAAVRRLLMFLGRDDDAAVGHRRRARVVEGVVEVRGDALHRRRRGRGGLQPSDVRVVVKGDATAPRCVGTILPALGGHTRGTASTPVARAKAATAAAGGAERRSRGLERRSRLVHPVAVFFPRRRANDCCPGGLLYHQ